MKYKIQMRRRDGDRVWHDCPQTYQEKEIAQSVARTLRRETDREIRVVDVLELHAASCQCHDCRPF